MIVLAQSVSHSHTEQLNCQRIMICNATLILITCYESSFCASYIIRDAALLIYLNPVLFLYFLACHPTFLNLFSMF